MSFEIDVKIICFVVVDIWEESQSGADDPRGAVRGVQRQASCRARRNVHVALGFCSNERQRTTTATGLPDGQFRVADVARCRTQAAAIAKEPSGINCAVLYAILID